MYSFHKMETISWYITSTQIRLSTSKYAKIRALVCLICKQCNLELILPKQVHREFRDMPDSWFCRQTLTSWVTWLCFSNQKCELTWSLSWALGRLKIGQVLSQPKWRNFRLRMKVLSVAALYRYINSDHSDEQTTKSAIRKECDHVWVHLFGLTNKSTWPKSLTSGTKLNCNAYFWIRGLPISVVRGSTLPIVLSSTEPFLSVFTQNTLHHSQKLEFFRSFKSDHTTSNYLDLTRGTAEREIGKTTNK